jgi:hypothetical protein
MLSKWPFGKQVAMNELPPFNFASKVKPSSHETSKFSPTAKDLRGTKAFSILGGTPQFTGRHILAALS